MSERRTSVRHKSLLRGRIYFNNRQSVVDCLVRDLSGEGAKLIFADTASIPDKIDLYIPQKEQTLHARVCWRSDEEVGIGKSESGWDSEMIEYCYYYQHGGQKLLFYNGNGFGRTGFGYAVLEEE